MRNLLVRPTGRSIRQLGALNVVLHPSIWVYILFFCAGKQSVMVEIKETVWVPLPPGPAAGRSLHGSQTP